VQKVLEVRYHPDVTARLHESRSRGELSVLNLVYDAMPIKFITGIITEFGLIPPTSVPVILREKQDDERLNLGEGLVGEAGDRAA
jgi:translation initiation factor eIF-2B subunit delta